MPNNTPPVKYIRRVYSHARFIDMTHQLNNDASPEDAEDFPNIVWPIYEGRHFGCGVKKALWSPSKRTMVFEVPYILSADMRGSILAAQALEPVVSGVLIVPEFKDPAGAAFHVLGVIPEQPERVFTKRVAVWWGTDPERGAWA